jgi:hypothetical protein
MTAGTGQSRSTTLAEQPASQATTRRTTKPVMVWAVVGAAWTALTIYCWGAWLVLGHARPSPLGPTPVPTWQVVSAWAWQIFFVISWLVAVYLLFVRPLRRDGKIGFDGLFSLAWFMLWALQDPWANYTVQQFNYSSVVLNLGCPQCHAPGWQSPGAANMAEPLLMSPGMYMAFFVGFCVLANRLMTRAQQRWPRMGNLGLIMIAIGFMIFWDTVAEIVWIRTGMYHMGGGIRAITLWHGHWYQMPINENLMWGTTWGLIASLRYFKNDRGETLAERGLSKIEAGSKTKQGLRFLALVGIMNTIMFLCFNMPHQWFSTHADYFPAEVQERSYFTNGMCGLGTDYACPGPTVPISVGPDSGHATPDGRFVAPKGLPVAPPSMGGS